MSGCIDVVLMSCYIDVVLMSCYIDVVLMSCYIDAFLVYRQYCNRKSSALRTVIPTIFLLFQALENLDTFTKLTSLYIGKNKITALQNLGALSSPTILSIQVLHFTQSY